jgi:hypothetical protein
MAVVTLTSPTQEPRILNDIATTSSAAWVAARTEISELVSRYAIAVDSRDLETLVSLFVPDVDAGRRGTGRDALRAYYDDVLHRFRSSMHFVGTHAVNFDDSGTRAHGHTYCTAEHEGSDHWFRVGIDYEDTYRFVEGAWLFERRIFRSWFTDQINQPDSERTRQPTPDEHRPHIDSPTWIDFWATTYSD